jgi:cell division protein FtsB
MVWEFFKREQVAVPEWLSGTVGVIQLVLNGAALIGGAIIWKLYVANLKAAAEAKDATIETVEKSRDFWKEKAQELEKQSPEVVEKVLAERIQIRDGEIARLKADKEFDTIAVRSLEIDKAELEQDLFRTQGFRAMLALEAGDDDDDDDDDDDEPLSGVDADLELADMPSKIEVALIGQVAVDSGQLMVTDPCYIDADWRREPFSVPGKVESTEDTLFNYSYDGACRAALNGEGHGQLAFELGHAGAGVAFSTAWGDGMYPVYAEKHDGRIVRVYVNVG